MMKIYRKDKIVELCKGKSVLHLGFIQHSDQYKSMIEKNTWLHEMINKVSSKLVGFDYLENDVEYLKTTYRYECYYADVTKLDHVKFSGQFEVIVCGELIEHLDNPGLMLEGIKRFMHKNSTLIITTPNPWSKNRLKLIKRKVSESKWVNPEHTCWYSFQTLKQLLERASYYEDYYGYYQGHIEDELNQTFKIPVLNWLKKIKDSFITIPEINSNGLFFIAKLSKH